MISQKLKASGLPYTEGSRGGHYYDQRAALAVLVSKPEYNAPLHANDPKMRKIEAEAEKAEIAVAKLKGELVSADEMRRAAAELLKTMYQRIVRVEPAVIASKCVGLDAIGIETNIREAMAAIFGDVRDNLADFLTVESDGTDEADEMDEDTESTT